MAFQFQPHYRLEGRHATLSASKYHWIRYSDDKFIENMKTQLMAARGTRIHAWAAEAIRLGLKQSRTTQTLNMYINDALGYRMVPEQILYYSDNAFGTADAISFRKERGHEKFVLRIHDLKTGTTKASVNQLEIYTALFCLEYGYKPHELEIILRIYQNDYCQVYEPDPVEIVYIMDRIVTFDNYINQMREEELL